MVKNFIGGVEGGGTHSHVVIMDSSGKILAKIKGPGTNHHLVGMKECNRRIAELIDKAKQEAGIPTTQPLTATGLSLSGCETEETNQELLNGLIKDYPNLSEKFIVSSDTDGSLAATSKDGGIVCIAGTGTNCLLINPDGSKAKCGGWGYAIGDEGSAWKIAQTAIKYCFDDLDNFETAPYSIDKVWALIKHHFNIRNQPDLLEHLYANFDKAFIASITKNLCDLAKDGDNLAKEIFRQAGVYLARSISAVAIKASPELTKGEGGLHVTCVGSVWLSWDLLLVGFLDEMRTKNIDKLTLIRLQTEGGQGAAYLASDRLGIPLDRDYSKNYSILYEYKKEPKLYNGECAR